MDLTDTQQAILALIAERLAADGGSPSQTEIAHAMGFKGVRAAQYHLEALEQAGYIRRIPGRAVPPPSPGARRLHQIPKSSSRPRIRSEPSEAAPPPDT